MNNTARLILLGEIRTFFIAATFVGLWLGSPGCAHPQETTGDDRTLSPYFFIPGGAPGVDRLPLKSTTARVRIVGPIAEVAVTQLYRNQGPRPFEAIYVFPASTRAAVHGLRMSVGDRLVEAVVRERGQARADYEQARAQGRTAALLEQQRPNVFQMNVANILPGDEVKVELRYTEVIVPDEGVYEFVFPTVVGPRYSTQPAGGAPDSERWLESPYQHEGQAPTYTFDFAANITAGVPIVRVDCPSHRTEVSWRGRSKAHVQLSRGEAATANRDVVLRYQLASGRIEAGVQLLRWRGENFFLLTAQPPARPAAEEILPREYIFVVDTSGSMHGFPLEVAKTLLRNLLASLRPSDSFNVLLFAGSSALLAERSLPAGEANVKRALELIDRQQGGGGTELVPALRRAFALPRGEGTSRTIVVVSDGYVTVEKEAFELVRTNLDRANLFAFGIGTSVNRVLIEGLARAGLGEPFVITNREQAAPAAARFRRMIASPVLADLRLEFDGFETYDLEPAHLPDLLGERPVVVVGKWRGPASGRIVLRGRGAAGPYRTSFEVAAAQPADGEALRYLWARRRIARLSDDQTLDHDPRRAAETTRLGLAYNLLTEFTSFVAIDRSVRADGRPAETVQQPLPLPAGVSDRAVRDKAVTYLGMAPAPVSMVNGEYLLLPEEQTRGLQEAAKKDEGGAARWRGNEAGARQPSQEVECVERAMSRWVFPGSAGETTVVLTLKKIAGRVRIERINSVGFLPRSSLRPLVAAELSVLGRCFRLHARLTLKLSINSAGVVTRLEVLP